MATKLEGEEGEALVAGPLKKITFFMASLTKQWTNRLLEVSFKIVFIINIINFCKLFFSFYLYLEQSYPTVGNSTMLRTHEEKWVFSRNFFFNLS